MARGLIAFRDACRAEGIVVCGCGPSLQEVTEPQRFVTIGVNDVGRLFDPTYLVVVNPRNQFKADRFQYVENSNAQCLFTQLDLGHVRPPVVRFKLGQYGGTEIGAAETLHYTQNSPYVAVCLAAYMGAKRIGLIGVDLTDNHFFGRTGRHPLAMHLSRIDLEYGNLAEALRKRGIELLNLSSSSRLTALPKCSPAEFLDSHRSQQRSKPSTVERLRIVSYATTPVAGVPAILARCIEAMTPHHGVCVWATGDYGNGVKFEGGVQWSKDPGPAIQALREADLVIVHNGKIDPAHRRLLEGKPLITMAHNYTWNVDQTYVERGFPGVVVGQYQATLPEFADWRVVPNPIPLWEPQFHPEPKHGPVRICFTPSGAHEKYPVGHRLYWHAKGFQTTVKVLNELARRYGVVVETTRGRQVAHAESLAMKRRAHIVIDECVTGSYHRNSLEGLAAGCVVVNGIGLLPSIERVLRRCCTPTSEETPFTSADLDSLAEVMKELVALGPEELTRRGTNSRAWIERYWSFAAQWQEYWMPAIDLALAAAGANHRPTNVAFCSSMHAAAHDARDPALAIVGASRKACMKSPGVSVIIPQGGIERVPLLAATIAAARQNASIDQLIISECGSEQWARHVAERWGAEYVFTSMAGPFNKSRALNVGTSLARHDVVVWWDNDVLLPGPALGTAVAEMRNLSCDVLFPFSRMVYLSESESSEVRRGTRSPADCAVVATLHAMQRAVGGVLLVRAEFLERCGGMCEEFVGWGGEDSAWLHKSKILGTVRVTTRKESVAYHLWHPDSGGLGGDPAKRNPNYRNNAKLFTEIGGLTTPSRILQRMPPAKAAPPWTRDMRFVFVIASDVTPAMHDLAAGWLAYMSELYGIVVPLITPETLDQHYGGTAVFVYFGLKSAHRATSELGEVDAAAIVVLDHLDDAIGNLPAVSNALMLAADTESLARLQRHGRLVWHLPWRAETHRPPTDGAIVVEVLSTVMNKTPRKPPAYHAQVEPRPRPVPVWMYWEGPCPDWIAACHETVRHYTPNVRVLGPREFDALWDTDRDIDIRRLHVAHRADFIRAYLLSRYGGMWLDSDCVVVRSLEPLLAALGDHDFIAHREREGYLSNAFMGARPGSEIARRFYAAVAGAVRSGRQLGWIAIGNEPLTSILCGATERWLELDTELVQPICWSHPEVFFLHGSRADHERRHRRSAYCYMLSNQHILKYQQANPTKRLLDADTFFNFTLSCAPSPSGADAHSEHLLFCTRVIARLVPRTVVEVNPRSGLWATLAKECAATTGALCETRASINADYAKSAVDLSGFDERTVVTDANDHLRGVCDLAILGARSWRGATNENIKLRSAAIEHARYVLIIAPLSTDASVLLGGASTRNRGPDDTLAQFLGKEALEWQVCGATGHQRYVTALLSARERPLSINPLEQVFVRMHNQHASLGLGTTSGPGATLEQTSELRQRLPHLLQHLGIESMLDAGCGDYFWQRHCTFGVRLYVGIDVIASLVDMLQQQFGDSHRSFRVMDARYDPLPRCDLVLCRDYLAHLSYRDIGSVLHGLQDSGSKYLLATTFAGRSGNTDIETGDWRPLDLCAQPFSFPAPIYLINEKCTEGGGTYADKSLGVWRFSDLEERIADLSRGRELFPADRYA